MRTVTGMDAVSGSAVAEDIARPTATPVEAGESAHLGGTLHVVATERTGSATLHHTGVHSTI